MFSLDSYVQAQETSATAALEGPFMTLIFRPFFLETQSSVMETNPMVVKYLTACQILDQGWMGGLVLHITTRLASYLV